MKIKVCGGEGAWSCGKIKLVCLFSTAPLHVGFIYCLKKRWFCLPAVVGAGLHHSLALQESCSRPVMGTQAHAPWGCLWRVEDPHASTALWLPSQDSAASTSTGVRTRAHTHTQSTIQVTLFILRPVQRAGPGPACSGGSTA